MLKILAILILVFFLMHKRRMLNISKVNNVMLRAGVYIILGILLICFAKILINIILSNLKLLLAILIVGSVLFFALNKGGVKE